MFNRSRRADERAPEGGAGERPLGGGPQLVELGARVSARLLGQQAIEGMLEVPLALVKLPFRPTVGDRLQHAHVGVADDSSGLARQRGQKRAPIRRVGGREGLRAPEPRLARHVSDRAKDVEGDPAGRNPPAGGIQSADAEGQVIE